MRTREFRQYSRRLRVKVNGDPSVENETSYEVFDNLIFSINDAECDIQEVVINRVQRIGRG